MLDDPAPPVDPDRPKRRPTLFRAILLSIAMVALPPVGVVIGSYWFDMLMTTGDMVTSVVIGAALCALAWFFRPILRALRRALQPPFGVISLARPLVHDPALVRALLAQNDLACARCGYNLRGLADTSCPECHAPIEVRVSTTAPPGPTAALAIAAAGAFVLVTAPADIQWGPILWQFFGAGGRPGFFGVTWMRLLPILCFVALSLAGTVLLLILVIAWLRRPDSDGRAIARWRLLRTAVVLTLVFGGIESGWITWMWLSRGFW